MKKSKGNIRFNKKGVFSTTDAALIESLKNHPHNADIKTAFDVYSHGDQPVKRFKLQIGLLTPWGRLKRSL